MQQTSRSWLSTVRARGAALAHAVRSTPRVPLASVAAMLTLGVILIGYSRCDCLLKEYDDAYITLRYAYNFATGKGLVFNAGDATDSASSFLYTLLLAFSYRIGLHNLPLTALVIGLCSAAGIAAVVCLACMSRTRRPVLSLWLAVCVGSHGMISGWSVSGMETVFFAFLIALTAYRMLLLGRFGWWEAMLVAASLLTRFEAILLALVWLLLAVWRDRRGAPPGRPVLCAQGLAIGAISAAFLLFKYLSYGTLLPHAFALKTITVLYAPQPAALWFVWNRMALALLMLALFGLCMLPRRFESAALIVYCGASTVSLVLGPYADWARYSTHLLPIAAMLASGPLSRLFRDSRVLGLVACALIAYQSYTSFGSLLAANQRAGGHQVCRKQIGDYLEHNLPAGTTVLSSDIGVIAYAAPSIIFVDAVGLTSKDILAAHERGESVDPVLLAKKPLILADTCMGACTTPQSFAAYHWLSSKSYWRTPLSDHNYASWLSHGEVLSRCRSPDGLTFSAAHFEFHPPPKAE